MDLAGWQARLEHDPAVVEQLAYCVPHAIPYSVFLGRPVGQEDSLWEDDDRMAALAFLRHERLKCPSCGTRREDWVDDEGMPLRNPRLVALTTRCHGCAAVASTRREVPNEEDGIHIGFVYADVLPLPEPPSRGRSEA